MVRAVRATVGSMIVDALLKPLLPRPAAPRREPVAERAWRALLADPALHGRVARTPCGTVVITGADGGPPPASMKERQRWELHVRLRLAVELGDDTAAAVSVRWATPGERV